MPDLEAFNRSIEAVHGLPIPGSDVAWSLLLGMSWIFGFLLVAVMTSSGATSDRLGLLRWKRATRSTRSRLSRSLRRERSA